MAWIFSKNGEFLYRSHSLMCDLFKVPMIFWEGEEE